MTHHRVAALGTLQDGAPYVSLVPYALAADGRGLVIHVSRLAAHTQNMVREREVSVLVAEPDGPDKLAHALAASPSRGSRTCSNRSIPDYAAVARRLSSEVSRRRPACSIWAISVCSRLKSHPPGWSAVSPRRRRCPVRNGRRVALAREPIRRDDRRRSHGRRTLSERPQHSSRPPADQRYGEQPGQLAPQRRQPAAAAIPHLNTRLAIDATTINRQPSRGECPPRRLPARTMRAVDMVMASMSVSPDSTAIPYSPCPPR